jgi:trehalose/maltose transport system permease protein
MAVSTSTLRTSNSNMPNIIGALFAASGVGLIVFLILNIVTNESLRFAVETQAEFSDLLLTFLNTYGIVVPLIMIGAGIYFIRLGMGILRRDLPSAAWAKQVLFWVMVLMIALFIGQVSTNLTSSASDATTWLIAALAAIGAGMAWFAMNWIGQNLEDAFVGVETLSSRDSRLAWNLLLPTVIVLLLVAARPLERTFIASLTDQRFAGAQDRVVNFVGLQNYAQLLGFRVDAIGCTEASPGVCATREVSQTVTETQEIAVDNEALRDILAQITSGQNVRGVPNLLGVINQPDVVQAAIDDPNASIVDLMLGFDGERPLGSTMLRSMINVSNPDLDIQNLVSVDSTTATVEIETSVTREETVYPHPRDVVGQDYRDLQYQVVNSFDILGTHYVLSARDAQFVTSVGNTLFYAVVSVVLELVLGMIIALTVNSKFKGRGLMRAAMLVPWAIPTVVSARLWEVMLRDNQSGVINHLLVNLGLIEQPIAWLASSNTQIWSLIFVDVWKTTPFFALLILAGLQTISGDIYEAADVDGASRIRQFFSITLPLLRPTLAVALVFRTLDAVRAFDVFDVLLGKQLQSMATYNSFVLIEQQQFGYASAVGVTIFVIILVFTVIYVRALGVEAE